VFSLGRRAIDLAVLFLALYALAFVPLGRRTGFEHLRAIFGTRPAREARHELEAAAARLGRKLIGTAAPVPPRGVPVPPVFPHRANAAVTPAPSIPRADFPVTMSSTTSMETATQPSLSSISEDSCPFR
jgi:hypothetical protein